VLEFFINNPGLEFTAEDIHHHVLPEAPLTSARRAISNLQKEAKLIAAQQVSGQYGRPIYAWKLFDLRIK
jgi:response regulator of citrate/malate metabolism